jgi:ComF family protein
MGEISQLLFPERCVGCSRFTCLLCNECKVEWSGKFVNVIEGLSLISSALYSSNISRIVLRAKENYDSRARTILARAIATHIVEASTLIPIPSSKSAIRRRGYDHALLLAQEVSRLTGSRVWPGLLVNRRIKDQTLLGHTQRFANLAGAYSLRGGNYFPQSVVLIDDLVTSGASMREALRTLRAAEISPLQAISACISSPHLPNTIRP